MMLTILPSAPAGSWAAKAWARKGRRAQIDVDMLGPGGRRHRRGFVGLEDGGIVDEQREGPSAFAASGTSRAVAS